MKVRLTATTAFGAWLQENKSIIGFEHTEIAGSSYNQSIEIELNHIDFYKLICNLTSTGDSLIINSADEAEFGIEIYNDYRE